MQHGSSDQHRDPGTVDWRARPLEAAARSSCPLRDEDVVARAMLLDLDL
jgi:hypothetical protein